jgi:plastocyanin
MKLPKLPITAALLVVVAIAAIVASASYFKRDKATSTPVNETTQEIVLTDQGFNPETISVKKGTRVIWVNNSQEAATVNSNEHPTHTEFPFLNLGEFEPGSSLQIILDKPGKYTYHNHLDDTKTGTIIVTE